jgi:competence protein ComGC
LLGIMLDFWHIQELFQNHAFTIIQLIVSLTSITILIIYYVQMIRRHNA